MIATEDEAPSAPPPSAADVFIYTGQPRSETPNDIKHVKVADGVKIIPECAFKNHPSLETVTMLSSVEEIGNGAFRQCTNLSNVRLENGLTKIGDRAFYQCKALEEMNVPKTVVEIGNGAFRYCTKLAKVGLQNGLIKIGNRPFLGCKALKEMNVPKTVVEIGDDPFEECTNMDEIRMSGHNLPLAIRLMALYPYHTSTFDKMITEDFSSAPIKPSELLTSDEREAKELERVKKAYIQSIIESPPKNVAKQHGWVEFLANHVEKGTDESERLVRFLGTEANLDTLKVLAEAKDRDARIAWRHAKKHIRQVFEEKLLLLGRYDLAAGAPIHKSATCVVIKAEDAQMDEYYKAEFEKYCQKSGEGKNSLDRESFKQVLQGMRLISGDDKSKQLFEDYFQRVDLDKSKLINKEEFVTFCLSEFGRNVVLKFMRHQDQFENEVKGREVLGDDAAKFVMGIIRKHDASEIEKNEDSLVSHIKDYFPEKEQVMAKEYKHVLVMPFGDRNLDTIFRSERPDLSAVRSQMREVGEAIEYIHNKGLVHGDIKLQNLIRAQNHMLLIDLDASARIDEEYVGAKFSSGACAPELIHSFDGDAETIIENTDKFERYFQKADDEDQLKRKPLYESSGHPKKAYAVKSFLQTTETTKEKDTETKKVKKRTKSVPITDCLPFEPELAKASMDVWSFGTVLYTMVTGENLFQVNRDDDIKNGDLLKKLCNWNLDALKFALQNVHDGHAKKVLKKALHPDPDERPTMSEILTYDFFHPERQSELGEEVVTELRKTQAMVLENRQVVKDGFSQVQQSLSRVISYQKTANSLLMEVLKGRKIPKYFIIAPQPEETTTQKGFSNFISNLRKVAKTVADPSELLRIEARLYFICPISLQPVIGGNGKPIGYTVKITADWVKKYGPAILVGLKIVQAGLAIGRCLGLPLPSLSGAEEDLAEASALFADLQSIIVDNMDGEKGERITDILLSKFESGVGTLENAMSDENVSALENAVSDKTSSTPYCVLQKSYDGIGELIGDKKFERCPLVHAACETESDFVHPDMKILYETHGAKCYKMSMAELESEKAKLRHSNINTSVISVDKSAVDKKQKQAESKPPEPQFDPQGGLGAFDEIQLGRQVNQVSNRVARLENQFGMLESQVQQSLSIRDPIPLSDSQRAGNSILLQGRFRIQSKSSCFPSRWREHRVVLYDDFSMMHFPASSGEWLRPSSSGQWQAKRVENGDGVELFSGGKVCTLRLSAKVNESWKSPDRQIDEWIAKLNSSRTTTLTDSSSLTSTIESSSS